VRPSGRPTTRTSSPSDGGRNCSTSGWTGRPSDGDTRVVAQASEESANRFATDRDFIVTAMPDDPNYRESKIPVALAIVGGVVGLAATGLFDILTTSLAGVVAMILTGVLQPNELYEGLPSGTLSSSSPVSSPGNRAFEGTGAAALVGSLVATSTGFLPAVGVLWVFYVITTLVTAVISNSASVIPHDPRRRQRGGRGGSGPVCVRPRRHVRGQRSTS